MKMTLHNESINIEIGQKVIFYTYKLNDNNEFDVITEETYVDVIDEKNNIVGFRNGSHSATLSYYRNSFVYGKSFYLSDTKKNRLDYLKFKVKGYELDQKIYDTNIEDTCKELEQYIKRRREATDNLILVNKLIEQLEEVDKGE